MIDGPWVEAGVVVTGVIGALKAWDRIEPTIVRLMPGLKATPSTDAECLKLLRELDAKTDKQGAVLDKLSRATKADRDLLTGVETKTTESHGILSILMDRSNREK